LPEGRLLYTHADPVLSDNRFVRLGSPECDSFAD
jgi:hypothetical protein